MTDESDPLLSGYHRFRQDGWTQAKAEYETLAAAGQKPHTLVVACSDSRADPALIFDAAPGQLFVVRNVANIVPPYQPDGKQHGVSAALEFAVQVLRVREVLVLGHGMCGGAHAALTQELRGAAPGEGGFIADWIDMLDEAREAVVREFGTEGRAAERAMEHAGVRVSLANLRTFPCVAALEERGKLTLRGAFFAISDGILHLLDERSGRFHPA